MTEHDDVIDLLRAARPEALPEDLVSPHAPAAQALLEEILSMQTIESPETVQKAEPLDLHRTRRGRRRFLAAGLAAAGIAAALAAVAVVVDPIETSEAAAVEAALTKSASSLGTSGRAEVTWRTVYAMGNDGELVDNGIDRWEYSGEDTSVSIHYVSGGRDAIPGDIAPINRYVDGELYLYVADRDGQYRWFHDLGGDPSTSDRLQVAPDTLLEELEPAGDFEEVGTETIDGVTTRRLRAENPGATPVLPLGATMALLGEVVSLEIWVDDDGLVRRVDLAFAGSDEGVTEASVSVRFYDFGEPITIEAPTDAEDIDPVG